jgi:hypothetical protein
MINAYFIAKYEAAQASAEIKAIKDKAASDSYDKLNPGNNLRKNHWSEYSEAKEKARLALTKIAIIRTYAECVGEAFGSPIYCDIPNKGDFNKIILGKEWKRHHALRGHEKHMIAIAYRSIIRTQNRIKQKPNSFKSPWVAHHANAEKWAEGRKNEAS